MQSSRTQLTALQAVGEVIQQEGDVTALLKRLTQRLVDLVTGAMAGGILIWEEAEKLLRLNTWHGASALSEAAVLALSERILDGVVARREGGQMSNTHGARYADPHLQDVFQSYGVLAEPLVRRGRVLGVLVLVCHGSGPRFPTRARELMTLFATPASLIVENLRLHDTLALCSRRLQTMTHLTQIVSSSLDMGEVLRDIAQAAASFMDARVVSIWTVATEDGWLDLAAFSDETQGHDFPLCRVSFSQGGVGWVATQRQLLHAPDVFSDARFVALKWWQKHGLQSFLGLPLILQGTLLGVLALNGARPFAVDSYGQRLLESFVAQAVIAINNARLFRELRQRTTTLMSTNTALQTQIAERRRTEEALRESEQRFRTIFAASPLGMALVGLNGDLLHVNTMLCGMTGYVAHELTGCLMQDMIHPEDVAQDMAVRRQLFAGNIPSYKLETRYVRKTGETFWINVTAALVRDAAGQLVHAVTMVEDITERKLAETMLHQARVALEWRVQERTAKLAAANDALQTEVEERRRAQAALIR